MSIGSSPFQGGGSSSIADATETTAGKIRIATSAEATTGTNDLTAMTPLTVKERIDAAISGGLQYKGTFNASDGSTNPAGGLANAEQGDLYVTATAGTIYGQTFAIGDHLLVNADMGGSITNSKIDKIDNTEPGALLAASNLSDVSNASTARTNLGLAIGTNVQAFDAQLTDVAGLTPADGAFIVGDGSNFIAESGATARASLSLGSAALSASTDFLAASSNLSDVASASTARTNLGLAIGTNVQAFDAQLTDVAGLTPADSAFIVGDGSNFVAESGATARGSLGLGSAALSASGDFLAVANNLSDLNNAGTARTNLGLAIGTNVQAFDAQLTDVAGLTPADGAFIVGDGSNFVAESGATARASLSLGSAALVDTGTTAGQVIVLDGSNRIPAVDGSLLTNLPVAGGALTASNNLSDVASASTARTNLGLAIGTNVQAHDAGLDSISGLTTAADKMIYATGSDAYAVTGLTSAGRALLDDADAAAQRTTLGLAIGSDVLANVVEDTTPQLGGDLDLNGQDIVTTSNADLELAPHGTGVTVIKGNTGGSGTLQLNCENNSHGIKLKGPPHSAAASYTLTLPDDDGSANEVLQTDGAGALSWVAQGGSAAAPGVTSASPSSNYTVTTHAGNEEAYVLTPSADLSVILPAASACGSGYRYIIKNLAAYTLTVDPNGSEYIDHSGQTTYALYQYDSVSLITDGSNWYLT